MFGGVGKVGLPDLHVNDVPALGFERTGSDQDFKRSFADHSADTRGNLHA